MSQSDQLGLDIRALRNARKMTLEVFSQRLERSIGWVSQVERGLSIPSMDDLRAIAAVFDVPLSMFFGTTNAPEIERGRIVRGQARRAIGAQDNGLVETLISPDLTDDFEAVHSTFLPGATLSEPIARPTTEVGYLISGQLDLWIDGDSFTVATGDSFRIRGHKFRWANPYDVPAVAVWIISPPVY